MTSFTKVPSSFVWPSLWLVKYWWGDFFVDLELFSNVFLAMFSNKRDEFCVMCSLDPLDLLGDMK